MSVKINNYRFGLVIWPFPASCHCCESGCSNHYWYYYYHSNCSNTKLILECN